MKLEWERPGVVRMAIKLEELAALIAGGRMALKALESDERQNATGLARVLNDFDRAARALHPRANDRRDSRGPAGTREETP